MRTSHLCASKSCVSYSYVSHWCALHSNVSNSCARHSNVSNSCARHSNVSNSCASHSNVSNSCASHTKTRTFVFRSLPFRIHALRIGDVAVVGAEGELFCHYQHVLERTSPARFTLAAGYSQVCAPSNSLFRHSFFFFFSYSILTAKSARTHT
jgi:hypothetical protein